MRQCTSAWKKAIILPMFTRPLELYAVPRCGPDSERNVYSFGSHGAISARANAALMIMLPSEWPMKLRKNIESKKSRDVRCAMK